MRVQRWCIQRFFIFFLFWCNIAGTLYGYIWYKEQLAYTFSHHPWWHILFVPDSPTASLFFCISLLFFIYEVKNPILQYIRSLIQSLAVVTLVKYGLWAIFVICLGAYRDIPILWQSWMLIVSHGIMAVQAFIYVHFFHIKWWSFIVALLWTIADDIVDYTYGVYPALPNPLMTHIVTIRNVTFSLTIATAIIFAFIIYHKKP